MSSFTVEFPAGKNPIEMVGHSKILTYKVDHINFIFEFFCSFNNFINFH